MTTIGMPRAGELMTTVINNTTNAINSIGSMTQEHTEAIAELSSADEANRGALERFAGVLEGLVDQIETQQTQIADLTAKLYTASCREPIAGVGTSVSALHPTGPGLKSHVMVYVPFSRVMTMSTFSVTVSLKGDARILSRIRIVGTTTVGSSGVNVLVEMNPDCPVTIAAGSFQVMAVAVPL